MFEPLSPKEDWKMEFNMFNCKCGEKAKWLVWYKDCGSLYNYRCTEHAIKDMNGESLGTSAYPVVCIRAIEDAIPNIKDKKPME